MFCPECKREMDEKCNACPIRDIIFIHSRNIAKSIKLALKRNDQICFDRDDWKFIAAILEEVK